jgi:hypothetical protein
MYVFMQVSLLNVSALPVVCFCTLCVHLKTICLFYVKISILLLPSYIHPHLGYDTKWINLKFTLLDVQHRLLMPSLIVSILFMQFKIKKFLVLFRHLWKFPEIFITTYCSLVHESPCFYNGQYLLDENVSIVSQNIKFIFKIYFHLPAFPCHFIIHNSSFYYINWDFFLFFAFFCFLSSFIC